MATEMTNTNENDGTPSNDQQLTPPSKQSFSEQQIFDFNGTQSQPNLNHKDLQQYLGPQSVDVAQLPNSNEKQCYVCNKKFGVRRMRRKHTCRRCNHKVCGNCSSKKRYANATGTMVRVCEKCLSSEHCIVMTHRLRNLKLKHNKRNGGTYIVKVNQNSKEYNEGLINKCKIIEINEQNVESLNAQLIADKLNTIKIPFSITLDYSQAEIKHDQLKNLKNRRKINKIINDKNKNPKNNKNINDKNKKGDVDTPTCESIEYRGAQRLISAHQNPYYFNAPGPYQAPVIVTGPSADIRNIYKPGVSQASYSDSYNDGYYGVIYEESSPHREKELNDDESDGEDVTSSEGEETDDDDDDDDSDEEDTENENENEQSPELMQYESDEENDNDTFDNKSDQNEIESDVNEIDNNPNPIHSDNDSKPVYTRAKSVPVTPIINGIKSPDENNIATTLNGNTGNHGVHVDEIIKSITLENEGADDATTSKTPKGDKSSTNILEVQERKKRSLSQDNLDPTSPPFMSKDSKSTPIDDSKKKNPIFKRKKNVKKEKEKKGKKQKKKRRKQQPELDDELTTKSNQKKKFFRRKKGKKHMENYTNLHNNIYGLDETYNKPVISSNVRDYTTQNLNPPNYTAMNGNNDMNGGVMPKMMQRQNKPRDMGSLQAKHQQLRYTQYAQQNVARQRLEMQQHIAQSNHVLVNPYRQFSIAFNKRPFNIKLQFRNGFNAFVSPSVVHIQQSHTLTRPEYIWGWYSVSKHPNIPIGSKLISINFEWIYGKNEKDITELMYNSPLPTTLIFEAPSYLHHIPPSIYIELNDNIASPQEEIKHNSIEAMDGVDKKNVSFSVMNYLENNKSIIYWWLEEGGFVVISLAILALIVLDIPWYSQFYYYLPFLSAFATVLLMSIPPKELFNLGWNIMHLLIFKMHRKHRGSGLTLFGKTLLYGNGAEISYNSPYVSISNDQTLLNPYTSPHLRELPNTPNQMASRRSMPHLSQYIIEEEHKDITPKDKGKHKKSKKHKKHKKIEKDIEEKKYEDENGSSQSEKDEEKVGDIMEQIDEDEFDENWETNICFPGGTSKTWGAFVPCTAKTLKLRGATYLNDKVKIASEEGLLSLANMDIFTVHHKIHHMAQNEVSWFHQNRKKLPRSLFFIIFHLRLDSMTASVVQYFYIDKNKFKHLLEQNEKVKEIAKEKGDGYFAIGGKGFDESGMFWNFINGPCNYRNDRLKLLARKEEGPWYMQIPSRPAIIGRQVPIEYMRGYNADHLNSTKVHNTRSDAYEAYDFKTLYHDPNKKSPGDTTKDIPCNCGSCHWINTKGEYPEYIEVDICCEVNSLAKNTIRVACPLAKSLMVEMHWTMEGQINHLELPERMLASARLIHVDLTKLVEVD